MNMFNENIEKLQYIYKVCTSVYVCITEMEQFIIILYTTYKMN